jgi:hypothetical protein
LLGADLPFIIRYIAQTYLDWAFKVDMFNGILYITGPMDSADLSALARGGSLSLSSVVPARARLRRPQPVMHQA